jgi:hypothetical protein
MKKFAAIAILFVSFCVVGCGDNKTKTTSVGPTSTVITNPTNPR